MNQLIRLILLLLLILPANAFAQTVPPGYSDDTELVLNHIRKGTRIPAGYFSVRPGIVLNGDVLRGSGPRTILQSLPGYPTHTLIKAWSHPEDSTNGFTGIPWGGGIEDITLLGQPGEAQTGIWLRGAHFHFSRVNLASFRYGVWSDWSVFNSFEKGAIRDCTYGVWLQDTITSTTFSKMSIRQNHAAGVQLLAGYAVTFHQTVFESNYGVALAVGYGVKSVRVADGWFERNSTHVQHNGQVQFTGITESY